ncbi:MAG: hypothetical protein Tsb0013_15490 [Phycisphaerales bacterium]
MPRRGFTILELLLALGLASLAIGTIVGLYSLLGVASRNSGDRFTDAASSTLAYEILQGTFEDLVAATPIAPDEATALDVGTLPVPAALRDDDEGPANLSAGNGGSGADALRARVRADSPVMFDLTWEEIESGVVVQRLELVTLSPPAAIELLPDEELLLPATIEQRERWRTPDRVRSAYEFVFDEEANEWDLVWRPVDPPGRAVPIIEGVLWAQWAVLSRSKVETVQQARVSEAWTDVAAAFLGEDFPIAVRLEFETTDGRRGDWLFETLVITREY